MSLFDMSVCAYCIIVQIIFYFILDSIKRHWKQSEGKKTQPLKY